MNQQVMDLCTEQARRLQRGRLGSALVDQLPELIQADHIEHRSLTERVRADQNAGGILWFPDDGLSGSQRLAGRNDSCKGSGRDLATGVSDDELVEVQRRPAQVQLHDPRTVSRSRKSWPTRQLRASTFNIAGSTHLDIDTPRALVYTIWDVADEQCAAAASKMPYCITQGVRGRTADAQPLTS
jgi:hypothetical protein